MAAGRSFARAILAVSNQSSLAANRRPRGGIHTNDMNTTSGPTTDAATPKWVQPALALLAKSQRSDGGWSYFAAGDSALEPSALAVAALYAFDGHADVVSRGLRFIESLRTGGGGLRPQPTQPDATGMAALGGLALAACGGNRKIATDVAAELRAWVPKTIDRESSAKTFSHDTTIEGFAWAPETFSWVEPSAYAILLHERLGLANEPRVREARRLLIDRAMPDGGWNYGNVAVLGTVLESDPFTSALALLALLDDPTRDVVRKGADYLRRQAANLPSALTLGWTALALRAAGDKKTVDPARLGRLLAESAYAPRSPWHHAVALLPVAPRERNAFILTARTAR